MGNSIFKTILLVDDDQVSNFINKHLLEKMEIAEEVKVVSNGQAGLSYLEEYYNRHNLYPDLILLDINMSVMDGKEFLKEFNAFEHKEVSAVRIGILTVSSRLDDKIEAACHGAEWFLNKPLTKEKMLQIIKSL